MVNYRFRSPALLHKTSMRPHMAAASSTFSLIASEPEVKSNCKVRKLGDTGIRMFSTVRAVAMTRSPRARAEVASRRPKPDEHPICIIMRIWSPNDKSFRQFWTCNKPDKRFGCHKSRKTLWKIRTWAAISNRFVPDYLRVKLYRKFAYVVRWLFPNFWLDDEVTGWRDIIFFRSSQEGCKRLIATFDSQGWWWWSTASGVPQLSGFLLHLLEFA